MKNPYGYYEEFAEPAPWSENKKLANSGFGFYPTVQSCVWPSVSLFFICSSENDWTKSVNLGVRTFLKHRVEIVLTPKHNSLLHSTLH